MPYKTLLTNTTCQLYMDTMDLELEPLVDMKGTLQQNVEWCNSDGDSMSAAFSHNKPRLLMTTGSNRLVIEFPVDIKCSSFSIQASTTDRNGETMEYQVSKLESGGKTRVRRRSLLHSPQQAINEDSGCTMPLPNNFKHTSDTSHSKSMTTDELQTYAQTQVDIDRLPHVSELSAPRLCSLRMQHITSLLEDDPTKISRDDLVRNLRYTTSILESVQQQDSRRLNDEDYVLNEVGPDAVPTEVREWLAQTFTNTQNTTRRKMDRPKLKTVAHAIRAGLMVDRIYKQMCSNSALSHLSQSPAIITVLKTVQDWDFNIWKIDSLSDGHALKHIGYDLISKLSLISKFKIDPVKLVNFLSGIESGYSKFNNPYHNLTHGADVCQAVYSLLHNSGLLKWLSDVEIYATVIAALIHDVEHTGTTNNFHINTNSSLALVYNDKSVLENHHLSTAFHLLGQDNKNIVSGLKKEEYREFRNLVIEMVLATDMSGHFSQIKHMKSSLSSTSMIDRSKALCLILHAADISHPSKPWHIHKPWVDLLLEEFFKQGDREKELGLPCSPLCDRAITIVEKSQVGFIDIIVSPTLSVLSDMLYKITESLDENNLEKTPTPNFRVWDIHMKANRKKWAQLDGQTEEDNNNNEVSNTPPPDEDIHIKVDRSTSTTGLISEFPHRISSGENPFLRELSSEEDNPKLVVTRTPSLGAHPEIPDLLTQHNDYQQTFKQDV